MALADKDSPATVKDEKDGKNSKVAEYLQAPRKKRKRYVLIATSGGMQAELSGAIEAYVRNSFKGMAIAQPRTAEDLQKNFGRQIMLLIYDDEFVARERGLEMLIELKRRRNQAPVPVLFLTRQPALLIEAYHRLLSPFHEVDDYINYVKAERAEIFSRIRHGLNNKNARKSRRYKIDIPLDYFLLHDDAMHRGRLIDLSVHGALLKAEDHRIFRPGDQLKLHVPVGVHLRSLNGDFLKLSARVRRIFIIGDQAGISFEHLSEEKIVLLSEYLTSLVADQAARRAVAMKARMARSTG